MGRKGDSCLLLVKQKLVNHDGKHTSSPKTRMSIHLTIGHIFSGSEIKMSETYQHLIFMAALFAINEI